MRRVRGARLGQHFLIQPMYARRLAEAVGISEGDTVLEIGPGKGALTKELLATGARVVAVEKDEKLIAYLREMLRDDIARGRLTLVPGDVRDFDPARSGLQDYVLAANIPYYITGEILRQFLSTAHPPRTMALLVQKEVAERIVARDGKESILSISVKAYGVPKVVAKVGRGNFSPPPSVDSAILAIDRVSKGFFDTVSEAQFFAVVRAGFSSKRKKLVNNLSALQDKEHAAAALAGAGIAAGARAETVPLRAWKLLAQQLS